jgi:hypothetical protein
MDNSLFGWLLRPRPQVAGSVTLDALDKVPPGMVRVSPASIPNELLIPGYENVPRLPLQDFWIDQLG